MFCFMWALVVKMFRLWATTCQDVSSLGRGVLCASVCMFWALVVKMFGNNLSSSVCMFCFMWVVFKMFRLWATTCQDVSSLGRGVLCVALVVKMFRLWATTCQDVSSLGVCVYVLFYVSLGMFRLWATTCPDVSSLGRGVCSILCELRQRGSVCVYVLWAVGGVCVYIITFYSTSLGRGVLCVLCELQDASSLGRGGYVCVRPMWTSSVYSMLRL